MHLPRVIKLRSGSERSTKSGGVSSRCATVEILAWRSPQETAGAAVQQWLGSPSHRAALLASTWTVMGVELTQRHATVAFGRQC